MTQPCKNRLIVTTISMLLNVFFLTQSVYGRDALRRTGSLAEHAREVVKFRESQSQNIRLNVLEEQPIINDLHIEDITSRNR